VADSRSREIPEEPQVYHWRPHPDDRSRRARSPGRSQETIMRLKRGATYTKERGQHLRRANLGIEKLRLLLRLAADLTMVQRLDAETQKSIRH
jgi:hypothetical protein